MAGLREAEQRAAAVELGVGDVVFLGYPDGRVTPSIEPRRDIGRQIRRFRPERVLDAPDERQNHVVDVTATLGHKVAALRAHRSRTAHIPDLEGRIHSWASSTGRRNGLPEGRCAEAYQVVEL